MMNAPEIAPQPDSRKQRARATRRRMVEAAYRLFCQRGLGVPLTAVAAEAGVAVQTVYFTFHTKVELLREALQYAVHGDDRPEPPHERPWFTQMVAEPDPRRAVDILLLGTQGIYDRLAPLAAVFHSGDPEVAAMWRHSEELRHTGMGLMVDQLLAKGHPRLDLDAATDVAYVLLGFDSYRGFVIDRGWTPERWRDWTAATLVEALFAQSYAAPDRGA
jgi:AcrR family transcriptional regulator